MGFLGVSIEQLDIKYEVLRALKAYCKKCEAETRKLGAEAKYYENKGKM